MPLKRQLKQSLDVGSEALVDEHVNKRIDAGVEGDNDDADDVGDVAVFLVFMEVIQHVDDQHRKPRDSIHGADLKPNTTVQENLQANL